MSTEALAYLEQHKIQDLFQQLTALLLLEKPADPRSFLVGKLEMVKAARSKHQNFVLFTKENLNAIFATFDVSGKGYITLDQYKQAMGVVGALKFNNKPLGHNNNRIQQEAFTEEALTALKRL